MQTLVSPLDHPVAMAPLICVICSSDLRDLAVPVALRRGVRRCRLKSRQIREHMRVYRRWGLRSRRTSAKRGVNASEHTGTISASTAAGIHTYNLQSGYANLRIW